MTEAAHRSPDFFIVGAPKCGTTSLYRWLNDHPDIDIPAKEPGYYSRDLVNVPYSKQDYLGFYRGCRADVQRIGDATPRNLYSIAALREIIADCPDAKAIAIVRNPVDLVVSFHAQMLAQAFESETDFEKAWNLVETRKQGNSIPRTCTSAAMLDYPFWGSVGTGLMNLYTVFKNDRILPFVLADLKTDPEAVYRKTLDFLELPHDGRTSFTVENQRVRVRRQRLHQFLIGIRRKVMPVYKRGTFNGGSGILKWVDRFNTTRNDHSGPVTKEFRKRLVEFFAPEVTLAEQALKRDLPEWKQ